MAVTKGSAHPYSCRDAELNERPDPGSPSRSNPTIRSPWIQEFLGSELMGAFDIGVVAQVREHDPWDILQTRDRLPWP